MPIFGCANDEQFLEEKKENFEKCKPFDEHKYRVFQSYYGKFYDTVAICDTPDLDNAKLIVKVFSEYHKNRPFEYFIKEIINVDDK